MTFKKSSDNSQTYVQPKQGCNNCGNCSGETGAKQNQSVFGQIHNNIRIKKC